MKSAEVLGWLSLLGTAAVLLTQERRARAATGGAKPATVPAPEPASEPPSAEVMALGRIIRSETGGGAAAERAAIAWCARNRAAKMRKTIYQMVCEPHCGPQSENGGTMRPFSSAKAPTREDLDLAEAVLRTPVFADPTGGATSAIVPALQDQLVTEGAPGYTKSYEEVRARWIKGGLTPLGRVGRWELWR